MAGHGGRRLSGVSPWLAAARSRSRLPDPPALAQSRADLSVALAVRALRALLRQPSAPSPRRAADDARRGPRELVCQRRPVGADGAVPPPTPPGVEHAARAARPRPDLRRVPRRLAAGRPGSRGRPGLHRLLDRAHPGGGHRHPVGGRGLRPLARRLSAAVRLSRPGADPAALLRRASRRGRGRRAHCDRRVGAHRRAALPLQQPSRAASRRAGHRLAPAPGPLSPAPSRAVGRQRPLSDARLSRAVRPLPAAGEGTGAAPLRPAAHRPAGDHRAGGQPAGG